MNISQYIKSYIFSSSSSIVALAQKSDKHLLPAEKLISKKIKKITNSTSIVNFEKLCKYHEHLNSLNYISKKLYRYDIASPIINKINNTSVPKKKWSDSLCELASALEKKE